MGCYRVKYGEGYRVFSGGALVGAIGIGQEIPHKNAEPERGYGVRGIGEVIAAVEAAGKVFGKADEEAKRAYDVRQKLLEEYNTVMKELDAARVTTPSNSVLFAC